MLAFETTQLTKFFSRKRITALNEVSLSVEPGVIFGLLGPNGAGKTTLIKILLGILYPSAGKATVLGRPINDVSVKEKIGYLPENHNYPDFLTGGQILDFYAKLAGVEKKRREENKTALLKLVEMEEWRHTKIRKYSKGMRQRLGLAQAMINDPEILFLDEPTDGVDPIGRKHIRDILMHLKEKGKTIFLNSHLLSEVEMICDKVAILDKGRLIHTGTVADLTSPSKTYRVDTSKLSDEIVGGIKPLTVKMEQQNGALQVTVSSLKKLNAIIDYMRQNQVEIKSIVPHKHSLEESFIEILKKEVEHG
jgi:ABC-2 type transport system ATP-binding protein